MIESKNLILGGGLTGLAAAQRLLEKKEQYTLIDKSNTLGGLTRSVHIDDYTFDYTGHFLHLKEFNHPKEISNSIDTNNWELVYKKSCCFYKGQLIKAPFQYNLFDLGEEKASKFYNSFLNASKEESEDSSLEDYFVNFFGQDISNAFLIPYNEKLLGIDLKKLGTKGLNRFFPHPNQKLIHEGAFSQKTNDESYNSKFWYPKRNGIEELVKALSTNVNHHKGKVTSIDIDNKIAYTEENEYSYENIISSIPLPELAMISNSKNEKTQKILDQYKKLHSSATLGINIGFKGKLHNDLKDLHWLYFSERKYIFHRIGFYSNFNKTLAPTNNSSIYIEVGLDNNQVDDVIISETIEKVLTQIEQLGYFEAKNIDVLHTTIMRNSYVRFDENWEHVVRSIRAELKAYNILSTGRYGRWDYTSMEDSILDGFNQRF